MLLVASRKQSSLGLSKRTYVDFLRAVARPTLVEELQLLLFLSFFFFFFVIFFGGLNSHEALTIRNSYA